MLVKELQKILSTLDGNMAIHFPGGVGLNVAHVCTEIKKYPGKDGLPIIERWLELVSYSDTPSPDFVDLRVTEGDLLTPSGKKIETVENLILEYKQLANAVAKPEHVIVGKSLPCATVDEVLSVLGSLKPATDIKAVVSGDVTVAPEGITVTGDIKAVSAAIAANVVAESARPIPANPSSVDFLSIVYDHLKTGWGRQHVGYNICEGRRYSVINHIVHGRSHRTGRWIPVAVASDKLRKLVDGLWWKDYTTSSRLQSVVALLPETLFRYAESMRKNIYHPRLNAVFAVLNGSVYVTWKAGAVEPLMNLLSADQIPDFAGGVVLLGDRDVEPSMYNDYWTNTLRALAEKQS